MEHNNQQATAWDAVPRDGPAVFIADRNRLDHDNTILGAWVNPTDSHDNIHQTLIRALGAEAVNRGDWVVVDQVGLGPTMLPEQLSTADLVYLAGALTDDNSAKPR